MKIDEDDMIHVFWFWCFLRRLQTLSGLFPHRWLQVAWSRKQLRRLWEPLRPRSRKIATALVYSSQSFPILFLVDLMYGSSLGRWIWMAPWQRGCYSNMMTFSYYSHSNSEWNDWGTGCNQRMTLKYSLLITRVCLNPLLWMALKPDINRYLRQFQDHNSWTWMGLPTLRPPKKTSVTWSPRVSWGQHKLGIHVPGLPEDGSDAGIQRGEGAWAPDGPRWPQKSRLVISFRCRLYFFYNCISIIVYSVYLQNYISYMISISFRYNLGYIWTFRILL